MKMSTDTKIVTEFNKITRISHTNHWLLNFDSRYLEKHALIVKSLSLFLQNKLRLRTHF